MFFEKVFDELLEIKGLTEVGICKRLNIPHYAFYFIKANLFKFKGIQFHRDITKILDLPPWFFIRMAEYEEMRL